VAGINLSARLATADNVFLRSSSAVIGASLRFGFAGDPCETSARDSFDGFRVTSAFTIEPISEASSG